MNDFALVAQEPVSPQAARDPDDRLDLDRVHDLRRARRASSARSRPAQDRAARRPPDRRQQDQFHPAAADRLFQSRRASFDGVRAGHPRQLVRRLLSGPEELHDRAGGRAGDLLGRLRQRVRHSAGGPRRPSSASAPARWSANAGGQIWLEGRRPYADRRATSSSRRTAARTPGTSPSSASSRPRTPQIDTNFMLFQYDYFDETRSFGKDPIGWLMLRDRRPRRTMISMVKRSTRCSPTPRPRPRPIRESLRQGIRRAIRQHRDDRRYWWSAPRSSPS